MAETRYDAGALAEIARRTARERGAKMIGWELVLNENLIQLKVTYKPRHWKHCPGCRDGDAGVHLDPKGQWLEGETASITVAI